MFTYGVGNQFIMTGYTEDRSFINKLENLILYDMVSTGKRHMAQLHTYLDVLNCSMTKNIYTTEMITTSGILAAGPVKIEDKVKAAVKTFTATTGGIIEFSESMTTSDAGFIIELILTKDLDPVLVQATSISAIDGTGLSTGFTKLLISGLEANKEYRIQLYPRGITRNKSEYLNWFEASDITAVTTN